MQDRRDIAHGVGKPIVLEEYGCCKAADYKGKRSSVLKAFHAAALDLDYAGAMTWQVGGRVRVYGKCPHRRQLSCCPLGTSMEALVHHHQTPGCLNTCRP
jgi:hypothetical protein